MFFSYSVVLTEIIFVLNLTMSLLMLFLSKLKKKGCDFRHFLVCDLEELFPLYGSQ